MGIVPLIAGAVRVIANFFIRHSPPPLGPLHDIVTGGRMLMTEFQRGMMSAAMGAIDVLAGLVKSKLEIAVASFKAGRGGMDQSAALGATEAARQVFAQAFADIETRGAIAQATLQAMAGTLGEAFADAQHYLEAMMEYRSIHLEVQGLQRQMEEEAYSYQLYQQQAAEALERQNIAIQNIQNKMKLFEMSAAEIPERFTRGLKRELDIQLFNEQLKQQAMEREQRQRDLSYQRQRMAEQRELQLLQRRETAAQNEMQLAEKLLQERQRMNQVLAQQAGMMQGISFKIDEAIIEPGIEPMPIKISGNMI